MNERLKLARKLLKNDGFIAISIDDSEQAYLKILMDEIFGEENFVSSFVWQKKHSGQSSDSKYIRVLHEYILLYTKNINSLKLNHEKLNLNSGAYTLEDEYVATRGKYIAQKLDKKGLVYNKSLDYEFIYNGIYYYPGGDKNKWEERQKGNHQNNDWIWRWSKKKVLEGIENGMIILKNGKIYSKQYQYVDSNNQTIVRSKAYTSLILDKIGTQGVSMIESLFDSRVFGTPKPVNLITHLINLHPNQNARVLDFFAGSGTTGHAVLELNREDGGNRSFTLVTNDQNNIGTKITYERLFRINKGEGTKGETFDWANKNESYKSNLNVYNINYFDVSLTQNQTTLNELIDKLKKLFKDFDINLENTKQNNYKLLLDSLLALKPQKADEQN